MNSTLAATDIAVLCAYFAALGLLGVWCARRTRDSRHFMDAGCAVPGWALALTLFGSFVSSVSFLAQPGKSYAAIWTGVAQSLVLVLGIVASLLTVLWRTPGGPTKVVQVAAEHHKFSLGSWDLSLAGPTVLVVFLYAVVENLRNFGINQTYVQLYATARSDRDARACVWLGAALYIPLAAMTFLVGTALYAFYTAQPGLLPDGLRSDSVFPHFIHT